jgi:hypothetical protein
MGSLALFCDEAGPYQQLLARPGSRERFFREIQSAAARSVCDDSSAAARAVMSNRQARQMLLD